MKVEHLLVVFGTVVGGLSAALAFYLLSVSGVLPGELPEGAQFENLADLRQSLTVRDERDQQPGGGVSLRSILRPHHSDLIIFELIPDLNVEFQGVPVRTNSHGMRGPEISLTKPADTYRIALLGDSFAFGWGVEEQQTFARVMERELNRMTKGSPRVELLNFGVPGYSAFQEVATLEEKALAFSPDAVLLYVVENDFGLPFFIRDLSDGESLVPGKEFHIDAAKKDDQEIQARRRKLINDMDGNRAILRLADFVRPRG